MQTGHSRNLQVLSEARRFPIRMKNKQMLYQFTINKQTKTVTSTNSVLKTADLFLLLQSVAKFLNVLFTTRCSHFSQKTTSYLLYKAIKKRESLSYVYHIIPNPLILYFTRNSKNFPFIKANHRFFQNTFFSIHHHRMEQIRFEYLLFSFL